MRVKDISDSDSNTYLPAPMTSRLLPPYSHVTNHVTYRHSFGWWWMLCLALYRFSRTRSTIFRSHCSFQLVSSKTLS